MSLADQLLVARLRARDEDAFNEAVRRYGAQVYNLILRMIGNRAEAEDLAQEVFVTLFKSIDGFRGDAKLSTWILQIAANHARNRIKYLAIRAGERGDDDASGRAASSLDPAGAHAHAPDRLIEQAETEAALQAAIAELEEAQRLLIILRDVEGLPYDEIAAITGLPEGTLKSRLHRARMLLKAALERRLR